VAPDTAQRAALGWFEAHAGSEALWADLEPTGGPRLATRAKGIYKPAGSDYARSVSQRLGSPYADEPLDSEAAGGWRYRYHREGLGASTNVANEGLVRCMEDGVPVGLLIQVAEDPSRYRVLGLAAVRAFENDFFLLEGPVSADGDLTAGGPGGWSPPMEDTRERARSLVVARYGQPAFRQALLDAYSSRCAVCGTNAPEVLEAAHIRPYLGPPSDHPANGLLLRADIHALFDLGLIAVDATDMTLLVHERLNGTPYEEYRDRAITLPVEAALQPSPEALQEHRRWTDL
jgi:putative restriction endonuclease